MKRGRVILWVVVSLAASAGAGPQYPFSALDYRAERDLQLLRQTLGKEPEPGFVGKLHAFVARYGYVPELAALYMEWAGRQTTIEQAAVIYAETMRRWPDGPNAQRAAQNLSEILLLAGPSSLDKPLTALREFSQRLPAGTANTGARSAYAAMAKVFLAAEEPSQARTCIAAAVSGSPEKENVDLQLLQAETYRAAGDPTKAAELFEELLNQPLSIPQKQAAASRLLDCIPRDDPRFDTTAAQLRDADPDSLVNRSLR